MTAIQWLRNKFGLNPHLTQNQVYCAILKKATSLASKGKVLIYKGGHRTLEEALFEKDNHVFILIIEGKKIKKPKALREWFKDYKI
jgi:hypothetical protein